MRHTFQRHFGASGLQRMELLKGNKLFLVHFSEAAQKFPTTTPGRLRELRHVENKCNRAIFRMLLHRCDWVKSPSLGRLLLFFSFSTYRRQESERYHHQGFGTPPPPSPGGMFVSPCVK